MKSMRYLYLRKLIIMSVAATIVSYATISPVAGDQVVVNVSVVTLIQMSLDESNIDLGSLLPGQPKTATTEIVVDTNSEHGYQISAHHSSPGYTDTLRHTDGVTYIQDKDDFDGTGSSTEPWLGIGFGFSVYSATEKDTAIWGTGVDETDANNRYTGFPDSSIVVHSVGTNVVSDITKIGYKADISSVQKAGSYAGNVTYSAVVIP